MNHFRNNNHTGIKPHSKGLHVVALFEGAKGILVLLVGFELLSFIHKDIHEAALHLVRHFHFNPASKYPRIFLDLLENVNDSKLWGVAIAAFMYCIVRIVEAFGLWYRKQWAEWFAVLTGGIYIPVEIYEAVVRLTWPRITVLVVNLGVVAYLLLIMIRNGKKGTT